MAARVNPTKILYIGPSRSKKIPDILRPGRAITV
jgi:hypothetical protein